MPFNLTYWNFKCPFMSIFDDSHVQTVKKTQKKHHDKHDNEVLFYRLVLISSPKLLSECGCVLMHASACSCITFSLTWRNSLSWETTHCRRRHPLSLSPVIKAELWGGSTARQWIGLRTSSCNNFFVKWSNIFSESVGEGKKQGQTQAGSACPNTNTWKVYSVDT